MKFTLILLEGPSQIAKGWDTLVEGVTRKNVFAVRMT